MLLPEHAAARSAPPDIEKAATSERNPSGTDSLTDDGLKRYNLVLPESLFSDVKSFADSRHITVVEAIRKFIKLGLIAAQLDETPGAMLLIRDGNIERQLVLI
jgi:hypothetical protein